LFILYTIKIAKYFNAQETKIKIKIETKTKTKTIAIANTKTKTKTKTKTNAKLIIEARNIIEMHNKNKRIDKINKENIKKTIFVKLFAINKLNKKNIKLKILDYYKEISKKKRQKQIFLINKY